MTRSRCESSFVSPGNEPGPTPRESGCLFTATTYGVSCRAFRLAEI